MIKVVDDLDWDKLRIFRAVADAGSFTQAAHQLGLIQSSVSRRIAALEEEIRAPLFHRHARGLLLTEQGDLLYRTVRDMAVRLENTRMLLSDVRDRATGELKVTTTFTIGSLWLTPLLDGFMELYPGIRLQLILDDEELDLGMREADIAIRMREPVQADLVRKKLFKVNFHVFASAKYLNKYGEPKTFEDLDHHRLLMFEAPSTLGDMDYLATVGRDVRDPRVPHLRVNSLLALRQAVSKGLGVAMLPDYVVEPDAGLVEIMKTVTLPSLDAFFVYPEELRYVARVQAFRDFLVSQSERWSY